MANILSIFDENARDGNTFPIHVRLVPRKTRNLARFARIIPRAMTFDFFSRAVFFLNILCRICQGEGDGVARYRGLAGGVGGYSEGPVFVSLFAFCLPAEHRGVQKTPGYDRTAETYRW